jgi:hypothetical protein
MFLNCPLRLYSTKTFLEGYAKAKYGILPAPAAEADVDAVDVSEEPDPSLVAPDLLSGIVPPDLKDKLNEKSKSAMQFPAWVSALSAKGAPALTTALKVALATAAGLREILVPGSGGDDKGKGKGKDAKGGGKDAKGGKGAGAEEEAPIDPKIKAAIDAEVAEAGGREVEVVERRLELLAERAAAALDFVSDSAKQTNEAIGKWIKSRFQVREIWGATVCSGNAASVHRTKALSVPLSVFRTEPLFTLF